MPLPTPHPCWPLKSLAPEEKQSEGQRTFLRKRRKSKKSRFMLQGNCALFHCPGTVWSVIDMTSYLHQMSVEMGPLIWSHHSCVCQRRDTPTRDQPRAFPQACRTVAGRLGPSSLSRECLSLTMSPPARFAGRAVDTSF